MRTFAAILKNDLKIILKDVKALLLLLVMPVLVILVIARAMTPFLEQSAFVEPFKVALVDKEGSLWTGILSAQLKGLKIIEKMMNTSENEAKTLIAEGEAAAAIILPENLSDSINYWKPVQGEVLGSSSLYLESQMVKNVALVGSTAVSSGIAALNAIYDYEQQAGFDNDTLYNDMVQANERFIGVILGRKTIFAESEYQAASVDPVAFYAASLMAIFVMFSSIPCVKMLAQERQLGILSRVQAAPMHAWQLVCSKLLISILISFCQFAVIAVFLSVAVKSQLSQTLLPIFPVFLATALASAAFSLFIAAIATRSAAIDLIANLSILLMAVVGGSIYPLSSMPEISRSLSVFAINRWCAEGFLGVLSRDTSGAYGNSLIMLLLLAAGYFLLAILFMGLKRRRVTA
jgi:ABC-2 type transport system permease protein